MKTMIRSVLFGGIALSALAAAPSVAEEFTVEGNVAYVSDYRFRGVSLSDSNMAIQGGFDASFGNFYAGTWASSIEQFGNAEIETDLYGGFGGDFGESGFSYDVGAIWYLYPGSDDLDYGEVYGYVGTTVGESLDVGVGVAYAPEQDSLGDDSNTYVYVDGGIPLGENFSLGGSIGYTDGSLDVSDDGDGYYDWSLGVSTSALGVDFGVTYIDTTEEGSGLDETLVFSVSKAL